MFIAGLSTTQTWKPPSVIQGENRYTVLHDTVEYSPATKGIRALVRTNSLKPPGNYAERKKPVSEGHVLHGSIYMKLSERYNRSDGDRISGCQGLEGENVTTQGQHDGGLGVIELKTHGTIHQNSQFCR